MMKKDWEYRRGDIYLADLSPMYGCEQGGVRPVIVIQNNVGNFFSPTLIVAMVTTKTRGKMKQPTHYFVMNNRAFKKPSVVLLEQLRTIDKQRILRYMGRTSYREMLGIENALHISLALNTFSRR